MFEKVRFIFDGTPCEVKAACTVWSGGKSDDDFKGLPITIRLEIAGHEALNAELIVTILRKEKRDPDGAAGWRKSKAPETGFRPAAGAPLFIYDRLSRRPEGFVQLHVGH